MWLAGNKMEKKWRKQENDEKHEKHENLKHIDTSLISYLKY